jgi:poly(A) polymerase
LGANYPSFAVTSFELVHERLIELARLSSPLARAFADAGFSLYAVGGSVRDAVLGMAPGDGFEIDYTTNARPDDIVRLMKPLCTSLWEQGRAYGTIGGFLRATGIKVEITTFRSEAYVDHSRKPSVEWGDSLETDLSRRDFTMNALALDVIAIESATPDVQTLFDFHHGYADLHQGVLRTPTDPEILFSDDPLRMMRAARFAARLALSDRFLPSKRAATKMAEKLTKVSPERIRNELDLLLVTDQPSAGLDFIVRTGFADIFLSRAAQAAARAGPDPSVTRTCSEHTWAVVDKTSPEARPAPRRSLPRHRQAQYPRHHPGGGHLPVPRGRGCEDDPQTHGGAASYPQEMVDDVSVLVELHLRFHTYKMGWSDKAVRRYVRDAGHLLDELNELTRCDCTTRNVAKGRRTGQVAWTNSRFASRSCASSEDLESAPPGPRRRGGDGTLEDRAQSRGRTRPSTSLMEIRLDEGEISTQEAQVRLREWC